MQRAGGGECSLANNDDGRGGALCVCVCSSETEVIRWLVSDDGRATIKVKLLGLHSRTAKILAFALFSAELYSTLLFVFGWCGVVVGGGVGGDGSS